MPRTSVLTTLPAAALALLLALVLAAATLLLTGPALMGTDQAGMSSAGGSNRGATWH